MARKDCGARGTGNWQIAQREMRFVMPGQTKDPAKHQELMLQTKKRRAKCSKKSILAWLLRESFRLLAVAGHLSLHPPGFRKRFVRLFQGVITADGVYFCSVACLTIRAAAWLASSRLETKALQSQRRYLGFTSPTHILFRWSDSGCWHRAQDWSPLMLKLYAPRSRHADCGYSNCTTTKPPPA
jgi:hypothetical protein